jgi:hypothetical protein
MSQRSAVLSKTTSARVHARGGNSGYRTSVRRDDGRQTLAFVVAASERNAFRFVNLFLTQRRTRVTKQG